MKKKNLLMTAIAIFGLAVITNGQVPSYVPTNGLVGWWPFDGNANDVSGNGNNGVVTDAILTADRFGNPNSAYSFDYTGYSNGQLDDMIYVSDNGFNSSEISISCWFNPSAWSFPGNPGSSAVFKRTQNGYDNPPGEFWYIVFGDDGQLIGGLISDNQTNSPVVSSVGSISLNNWFHVVLTYDGSVEKLYLNGILIDQLTGSNLLSTQGTSGLSFGVSYQANGYWRPFNGGIDESGLWNRALTQQEVSDLYNGCQLSISAQPSNQQININNNAQFTVNSSDPNATYQWQTDLGVGFQNLNSVGQYSGATNDTLTVSNVTMSNNNQPFRCIISSGSCSDTSSVAVLTVNNNVGINESTNDNLFSVFPNPAQSIINVKADSKLIGDVYSIYDNTGRVVLTGKLISQNTTIELGNLSGGIYIFSIGENMKQTFKIIKAE